MGRKNDFRMKGEMGERRIVEKILINIIELENKSKINGDIEMRVLIVEKGE